eukprot:TRINITY_DN36248_c0_g1_i1.p1 TRINITY_DN36248_c0_g1~~TRINITY_DN36248_c0_g1_i1.p1  ORF type:complete len:283 (-),score=66.54 TRINITY_DN36248_c0_g1_i1:1457-2248(-)
MARNQRGYDSYNGGWNGHGHGSGGNGSWKGKGRGGGYAGYGGQPRGVPYNSSPSSNDNPFVALSSQLKNTMDGVRAMRDLNRLGAMMVQMDNANGNAASLAAANGSPQAQTLQTPTGGGGAAQQPPAPEGGNAQQTEALTSALVALLKKQDCGSASFGTSQALLDTGAKDAVMVAVENSDSYKKMQGRLSRLEKEMTSQKEVVSRVEQRQIDDGTKLDRILQAITGRSHRRMQLLHRQQALHKRRPGQLVVPRRLPPRPSFKV